MAELNVKMPTEYMEKINKLGADDGFYRAVVSAAKNPLKKHTKAALQKHRITGQLEKNVKAYVKKNSKTGEHFAIAAPVGDHVITTQKGKQHKYPSKNVAAHIEYGTSRQQPRPFVDETARKAEPEATEAMQAVIDKKCEEMGL